MVIVLIQSCTVTCFHSLLNFAIEKPNMSVNAVMHSLEPWLVAGMSQVLGCVRLEYCRFAYWQTLQYCHMTQYSACDTTAQAITENGHTCIKGDKTPIVSFDIIIFYRAIVYYI
jgi:hypothetical protein